MDATQIKMLGESARSLAASCESATADNSVITESVVDSLRRKLNTVKSDGKGLARKRK